MSKKRSGKVPTAPAAAPAVIERHSGPTRNLILVRAPQLQSLDDFKAIGQRVRQLAPDIAVYIVAHHAEEPAVAEGLASRPSLVFSPIALGPFQPKRGKVYCGQQMSKLEQVERLAAAGVPVPRTAVLTPDLVLDPDVWGPLVLFKPVDQRFSSHGEGIVLKRTQTVRYRPPDDYSKTHPGRHGPMLVQQFIDTGTHPSHNRVLTLFGEAIYSMRMRLNAALPPLDSPDEVLEAAPVAVNAWPRTRMLIRDPDILALARQVYRAVPEVPLHGCDILREAATGKLFAIEINPGGNTWHFSSDFAKPMIEESFGTTEPLINQFGVFGAAARVLIDRTRAEAE